MSRQNKQYSDGKFDGLTDLSYELNDVQLLPLYTWIHADLNGMFSFLGNCYTACTLLSISEPFCYYAGVLTSPCT